MQSINNLYSGIPRRILSTIFLLTTIGQLHAQEVIHDRSCLKHIDLAESLYRQQLYGQARAEIAHYRSQDVCKKNAIHQARAQSIYLRSGLILDLPQAINQATVYIDLMHPNPYISDLVLATAHYFYRNNQYGEAIKYYDKIDLDRMSDKQLAQVSLHKGYAHFILKEFKEAAFTFSYAKDIKGPYFDRINYYHGMTRYFLGDYDAALKSFRRTEASPEYRAHIPYYICQIHYQQKEYNQLLSYGEKALADKSVKNATDIHQLLGQIYFKEGAYEKALLHLEYYEQNTATLTQEEFYQLAFAQYKLQAYDKAKANFLELSGLQNQLGQVANYYLADCLEKLGDKASARAAFKKVSQMNFSKEMQEEAAFNYGKLSIEQGHEREALNILTSLKNDSPYYNESQTLINDIVKKSEDYENSISILDALPSMSKELEYTYQKLAHKRAMQAYIDKDYNTSILWLDRSGRYPIDPTTVGQSQFWRARIAHNQGQYQQSITLFQKYFSTADTGVKLPVEASIPVAYYYQAYNNLKLKDYTEAGIGFSRANTLLQKMSTQDAPYIHGLQHDASLRLADCHFKGQKYNKAIQSYERVTRSNKNDYIYAQFQKATILGLQGKSYDQIVTLEKIRNSYPQSEYADDALLMLGSIYIQQDKPEPALLNFEKLINDYGDKSPLAIEALLKMGLIHYNQNNYATALKLYKKVLHQNPSPDQSQEALRAIEEIFVNELGKTKDYIEFVDSLPGVDLNAYTQDSLQFRAAESQYTYGNYSKSIELFSDYLANNTEGSFAISSYFIRGEAYAAQKKYKEALADYRSVVRMGISTYYERALYKSALISYNHTQDFEVSYNLNNTLSNYTQDKKLQKIARLYALQSAFRTSNKTGIEKHAQLILKDSESSESDRMTAHYYLGKTLYQTKEYSAALEVLQPLANSTKSTNQRAEAAYLIAMIAFHRNDYNLAEQRVNEANKRNKNYPSWIARGLLLLSDIYIKKENLLNARAAIEAVLDNFSAEPSILDDAKVKMARLIAIERDKNRIKKSNTTDTLELNNNGN